MCEAIEAKKGYVSAVAKELKISRTSFYAYLKDMPKAQEKLAEVREARTDFVESKLMGLIDDGNVTAIIFYLKTQAKERGYVERQEVTGAEGEALKIVVKMQDDDL